MLLWLTTLTFAAVPDDVRPVVAPMDVQAQVTAWRSGRGLPAVALVCPELWEGALRVCFHRGSGAESYVHTGDLAGWGVDEAALLQVLGERAQAVATSQLTDIAVDGTDARYQVASNVDGWGAAPLLAPQVVARRVGEPAVFAVPAQGVVMAWRAGRPDVDKILAVGVREIHASRPGSITPVVHRWTGTSWSAWAEAVPRDGSEAPVQAGEPGATTPIDDPH